MSELTELYQSIRPRYPEHQGQVIYVDAGITAQLSPFGQDI
jgi:hypothetical protein